MSTYTCCLPESGSLVKSLNASQALDMEARGVLCASDSNPQDLQTIHAQCPGPLYYPSTTLDPSTGLPSCQCTRWDKPLPMAGMEGMGSPSEGECMAKCKASHAHLRVSPHMPVDMVGGKCVAASSDLADYPSYMGGLETCCLVGDFAEGYDADVWGPGSLCNRLFPQEKVWLQVPWSEGVQRLCKQVPKREVEEHYPGIQNCKTAYAALKVGDPVPPCYLTEAEVPHGPQVRQCWTGVRGIGEMSPSCGAGSECGYMPSCVAYPPWDPVWDGGAGGPTATTCHIARPSVSCDKNVEPYLAKNQQVGYQCADGVVSCCVQSAESDNVIYPTLQDVAKYQNCPAALDLESCPTCPSPGSAPTCKSVKPSHGPHFVPLGGRCDPNPGSTPCAGDATCVVRPGGKHGICRHHA